MVSVDERGLRGSGGRLKEHISAAASAVLEEWTKVELQPSSLYGIRIYHEGTIMLPHVDWLPLVVSAVTNVAQDVEEDWPRISSIDCSVFYHFVDWFYHLFPQEIYDH